MAGLAIVGQASLETDAELLTTGSSKGVNDRLVT